MGYSPEMVKLLKDEQRSARHDDRERLVAYGDKIADNDPRMSGRVLTVTGIGVDSVDAVNSAGRKFSISLKRIFTDDKVRKSGFSLVR